MHQPSNALVVYRPPDPFTATELAILPHLTKIEYEWLMWKVMTRTLGVPTAIMGSAANSNYSSASLDHTRFNRYWNNNAQRHRARE